MTGHSETVTPESAKRLGIRSYLRKPIVTRELAVALRNAIDGDPAVLDSELES
jgi:DNA-binding NarL/FixJ family response regulator